MRTAKLIEDRGDQIVLFPKSFRFKATEVVLEKRGDTVMITPMPKRAPKLKKQTPGPV